MTSVDTESGRSTVAVVGGGLVGALTSLYFAKHGWNVLVYEKRQDMRLPENKEAARGRSINLAISERGLAALRRYDPQLEKHVISNIVPMYGRMIHDINGNQESHPYSIFGQHINSVSRLELNNLLLDKAEEYPNVTLHFDHSFISADFDARTLRVLDRTSNNEMAVSADLIVGADGAYSKVRQELQRRTMVNFQQEYIEHGYCELTMDPKDGDYAIHPNRLHIWPRKTFMLIALPNLDKSFTCTLFMPWKDFDQIKTDSDLISLFEDNFSDALQLIGKDKLKLEYFRNPKGSLGYVKCKPYNYKDRVVILGDAAHCMVPFYGQGVNCGFQDIAVLDEILLSAAGDKRQTSQLTSQELQSALDEYSETRPKDAAAIVDLALNHYIEMRSNVSNISYKFRKLLDESLQKLMPTRFIPLYSMVTFSQIPYSQVISRSKRQTKLVNRLISASLATISIGAISIIWRFYLASGQSFPPSFTNSVFGKVVRYFTTKHS